MKIFEITFEGSWLGGKAIVVATTEDEALEIVKSKLKEDVDLLEHQKTITEVKELSENGVIHYDTGEY